MNEFHSRIDWPKIETVASYLADLANEPFDEVSRQKYMEDATALLAFIKGEIVIRPIT